MVKFCRLCQRKLPQPTGYCKECYDSLSVERRKDILLLQLKKRGLPSNTPLRKFLGDADAS
jgi:predicted amidophosphoribosyltransferase